MSSQAQVNSSPAQYILYYNGVAQSDPTIYNTNLSDVCSISFNSSGNISISGWQIIGYGPPSNTTLLGFSNSAVLTWYKNNYGNPVGIMDQQPYVITTANLASMRTDGTMVGYLVLDTTAQELKSFDGSVWAPLVTSTTPGVFLPLSGGTMTGDITLGTHGLLDLGTLSGAVNSRSADNIVSNAGASTSGNVATFSGTSGKVIVDSGSSLSQYLPLAGGTMTGDIALGTHNLTNVGTISGAVNSCTADNIVNNTGAATSGDVAVFSGASGKIINDTGIVGANLVTNAGVSVATDLAIFTDASGKVVQDSGILLNRVILSDGSVPMVADFDMGSFNLDNFTYLTPVLDVLYGLNLTNSTPGQNVIIGDTASAANTGCTAIGNLAHAGGLQSTALGAGANTGSGSFDVAIGRLSASTGGAGVSIGQSVINSGASGVAIGSAAQCGSANGVALGRGANSQASAAGSVSLGFNSGCDTNAIIAIGNGAIASGSNAIAIGVSNSTANSCAIGGGSILNIRAGSIACTLGTSAAPFNSCYLRDASLASGCRFSMYGAVTVGNTTTDTSLLTGTSKGSLVVSSGAALGTIYRFNVTALYSGNNTDTVTFSLKSNGTTLVSQTVGPDNVTTNGMQIIAEIAIAAGSTAQCSLYVLLHGKPPGVIVATPAYNAGISNTFDLSAQWSAADPADVITANLAYIETIYSQ